MRSKSTEKANKLVFVWIEEKKAGRKKEKTTANLIQLLNLYISFSNRDFVLLTLQMLLIDYIEFVWILVVIC